MLRRLALLALALAALLPVASASAAPQTGVNIGGPVTGAQLDQVLATGARSLRLFAPWNALQPDGASSWNEALLQSFAQSAAEAHARGARTIFVLTGSPSWASGVTDSSAPPRDPAAFARYAAGFASRIAAAAPGAALGYELWNEPDAGEFWAGGPDAIRYAALIKTAYPAVKAADPGATVVLGPFTGNDYAWLEQLYGMGVGGSFDAVAVHTDTACLDRGPDAFYRDPSGRLGQYTFLAYREVRAAMEANGDGGKPIWMTELGWSATTQPCSRGAWAGKKPAGVGEANQAAFLRLAFHCMAGDAYVEQALWFAHQDNGTADTELNRYGLLRSDGSRRPAWDAFRAVATRGDTLGGPCGDFDGPAIKVLAPTANVQFVERLVISASFSDPGGLRRVRFSADGKAIFNQVDGLKAGVPVRMTYFGSKDLTPGRHTITVEAVDTQGNTSHVDVPVVKVTKLGATLPTLIAGTKLSHRGLKATISGRVRKSGQLGLGGHVQVQWQWRGPAGWKKVHGGLRSAKQPFRFRQTLKRHGRWRVQVKYLGAPPYKASASKWLTFRA